jgi:hypothetical protein
MIRQTKASLARGQQYFVLTYHSSSLMPGGSPYSRTIALRDEMLQTLTGYLRYFKSLPDATTTTIHAMAKSLLRPATGPHSFASRA